MLKYTIPLRYDVNAILHLPRDLTEAEVQRIKAMLDTLPIPAPASGDVAEITAEGGEGDGG